jgi:hypothetical protein
VSPLTVTGGAHTLPTALANLAGHLNDWDANRKALERVFGMGK